MSSPVVPVAAKDDLFTIVAEHGERVETFVAADLLDMGTILVHRVHIEGEASLPVEPAGSQAGTLGRHGGAGARQAYARIRLQI